MLVNTVKQLLKRTDHKVFSRVFRKLVLDFNFIECGQSFL